MHNHILNYVFNFESTFCYTICEKWEIKCMMTKSTIMMFIKFGIERNCETMGTQWFQWSNFEGRKITLKDCRNPTLGKVGECNSHSQKWETWSPPELSKTQEKIWGVKSPCIGALFMSLKRSQSVDVQNGLAWAIWTFAAQVMGKRKAGSQIDNLTSDH